MTDDLVKVLESTLHEFLLMSGLPYDHRVWKDFDALTNASLTIEPSWSSDMDAAPRNEWLWTYWESSLDDTGFYEVARLDGEYFGEPTWVIQNDLEPVKVIYHKITHWRISSPPPSP